MSGLALTVYPLHHRQFFIRFETSHGPSWDGETTYKITSDLFPTEHFNKRGQLIKKPLIWPDNVKHVVDECTSSAIKSDISDDEIATILTKAGSAILRAKMPPGGDGPGSARRPGRGAPLELMAT